MSDESAVDPPRPAPQNVLIQDATLIYDPFKLEHKESGAVCDFLVSLRGKMHHRNAKRRSLWHPDQQAQFEMEAGVLEAIVHRVVFPMIWSYLENEKVTKTYRKLFN